MRKTQFTYFIEREGTMRPPIYISAARKLYKNHLFSISTCIENYGSMDIHS